MYARKITKVLIANRGEIALRIIRACKELEIKSVCVFSTIDANGVWVRKADESYLLKGDPIQVYLDYKSIVALAKEVGADAIHPGYGFLSENADFAQYCIDHDIAFIGPKPDHIALFGDKMASKIAMKAVGVPVLEGTEQPIIDMSAAIQVAREIGFPVIIKAAFGGGGKGMRIVKKEEEFIPMFEAATQEAERFFGRGDAFIEKYVQNPRHIEVQIMADKFGNVIHLGERDCSIQRRHQKVVEIAPSPRLNNAVRQELLRASKKAMFKLGYESVGTMEYLVDEEDNFYFIEMNTRVQVEHTITEAITGIDIVQSMIHIAEGKPLPTLQEDIKFRGYAIECRINAEDPKNGFIPSSGRITTYLSPGGPGVRLDAIGFKDYVVPTNYDSMIGKMIVVGIDWEGAVRKARRALDEFIISGIPTNIPLHRQIVRDEDFKQGIFDTTYLDKKLPTFTLDAIHDIEEDEIKHEHIAAIVAALKNKGI
ncbi:acetyl-CoA carboxylase biotin carboxylase subunit [Sulfurospirillum diekertiae]|uniref:2-oxoglutarate carboxylase n=1 Tax=Sulfurospirillum diekertiae TaxID=1854492 RepID=A0A290HUT2_9BACT|nr:acetyl-CoA carboxylase biotin carboxylase subunit [Sulfurospirillum diekertiae]ATB70404.1 2-oxoglutarate carboxylase [Sulfurospirillum diekertiae]QIR75472.1 acetyl-CoA carboxylase biotin carboxylase subunit [Sulfurospirillum diekertiae]QIR78122.1 acetyl-CoA carboxylase biotin carboxylase subunit [Sulfurospirillum diekertiae]